MLPRDKKGRFAPFENPDRKKFTANEVNALLRAAHIAGQNATGGIFSTPAKKADNYVRDNGVK